MNEGAAAAVRAQCACLLEVGERDGLAHFGVDFGRLAPTAAYVAGVIRQNYPALQIPHHARWRHFSVGGVDRWGAVAGRFGVEALPRVRVGFCIVSVLLDAGAGAAWRYRDAATGQVLARSEGLGVASLRAFEAGVFSTDGSMRVDAAALMGMDAAALGAAFQVGPANPLAGLEGRAALLRRVGAAVGERPDVFVDGDLGGLFDAARAGGVVRADAILGLLLAGLGGIWPARPLGDVWPHAQAPGGMVPFHKLSQWLAYSLIEVFEEAGVPVEAIDALTGLPEYRNGGLLLDMGVLQARDAGLVDRVLGVGDEAVVEWRALTVALLDRLAPLVRAELGCPDLALSRILEGGTWASGRAIAAARRVGGGPPLTIESDGTVF